MSSNVATFYPGNCVPASAIGPIAIWVTSAVPTFRCFEPLTGAVPPGFACPKAVDGSKAERASMFDAS